MVLDGLDPSTEYYINVTAVTVTESDTSNGLRVTTLPDTGGEQHCMCVDMFMCEYVSWHVCVCLCYVSHVLSCSLVGAAGSTSMIWIVAVILIALVIVAIFVLAVGIR